MKNFTPKSLLYKFDFGRFKGLSLMQVYEGCLPIPQLFVKSIIGNFIMEYECEYELTDYMTFTDGKFISMQPYNEVSVAISKDEGVYSNLEKHSQNIEKIKLAGFDLLEKMVEKSSYNLRHSFGQSGFSSVLNFNDIEFQFKQRDSMKPAVIADWFNLINVNGMPDYVDWCINNLDWFFVAPETIDILEATKVNTFCGFKLKKLSDVLFLIEQFKIQNGFKFSEKAKLVNTSKYEKYLSIIEKDITNEIGNYIHGPYERPKPYSQQDFIDDAFGGEASAYWNID